eukprot:6206810-Alexandrium_andersonii.AAC.1
MCIRDSHLAYTTPPCPPGTPGWPRAAAVEQIGVPEPDQHLPQRNEPPQHLHEGPPCTPRGDWWE